MEDTKIGKDHRHGKKTTKRVYYGSKRVDSSCRCNGGCDYCLANRKHRDVKRQAKADYYEEEEK